MSESRGDERRSGAMYSQKERAERMLGKREFIIFDRPLLKIKIGICQAHNPL